ncbi:hypothetical protein [Streptomyces sp. NPDC013489]|uniref:hypothetical protein n=1 Tax=Streptomyces sp. NPDC013489 TaxID=3155606 RepID=UPI0033D44C9B
MEREGRKAGGLPSRGLPAAGVDAIATDLEAAPRIDYRHRRQALFDWTLPADHWHDMLTRLTIPPGNRAITDDRKRLAVTAYI